MAKLTIDLLTVKEAAEELGVSVFTIYRAIKHGRLRTYELGPSATMLDAYDVDRLKAERQAKSEANRAPVTA